MKINELILGSTSPYRAQVLKQAGILDFQQMKPDVDESSIDSDESITLAQARSELKMQGLSSDTPALAITGDQVLEFEGRSFGKAANREEAFSRLQEFSGKDHFLHSAFTIGLLQKNEAPKIMTSSVVTATMSMRNLMDDEINAYLDTEEWIGCAGCYQFENRGVHLFRKIIGDSTTIIGLPMPQIIEALASHGIHFLTNPSGPWHLRS